MVLMSEVSLYNSCDCDQERKKKSKSPAPYIWWHSGGGLFLMSEAPL